MSTEPINSWHYLTPYTFRYTIEDSTRTYNWEWSIEYNNDYAYRNLYLFVVMQHPSGLIEKDTLHILLADEQGKWFGKKTWYSSQYHTSFQGVKDKTFAVGEYEILIYQGMREDQLKNINKVELNITSQKVETQ